MKKKFLILAVCLMGLGGLFLFLKTPMAENADKQAQAEKLKIGSDDVENSRAPMFTGVEQVKIYVTHHDGRAREDRNEETIPAPLRKENIEELLVDMYSTRFSSEKCGKGLEHELDQNYLHGCKDQPVRLISSNEYTKFLAGKDKTSGTLYVIFQIGLTGYHPAHFSPSFEDAIVKYYIINIRPGEALFSPSFPEAFPISQDEDVIKKLLTSYIARSIKQ